MKPAFHFFITIISIFSLSSCHENKIKEETPVYHLNKAVSKKADVIFNGVEAIPLLFEAETYPGVVADFKIIPGYIIIRGKHDTIHIFKEDGHYVSCSENNVGSGPGEYSIIMGYTWNPFCNLIEIITPNRLLCYDISFNFIKSAHIPTKIGQNSLMFSQIFDLSPDRHILVPTSASKNPFRIILYDSNKGNLINEFDYSSDVIADISMQYDSFFRLEDERIMFCTPAITKCVYELATIGEEIHLMKSFSFNLGRNGITNEEYGNIKKPEERSKNYINSDRLMPIKTLLNTKTILSLMKEGRSMKDFYIVMTDRISGETISSRLYDDGQYRIPIIGYLDEKYAYSIVEKEFIMDNPDILMGCYSEKWLEGIEDENLILLKYRLR